MRIAVVGATGAVGRELLAILADRRFPVDDLVAFASERSVGKPVRFRGADVACRGLADDAWRGVDLAFFDASDEVSREWAPRAARAGAWVVDNSGAFRMHPGTPLVVPEVNGREVVADLPRRRTGAPEDRILAGPNCSTVQLVMALEPLRARYGLKRVVVTTFQSVSGAGSAARDELKRNLVERLAGRPGAPAIFPHEIAFNCIPHIGGARPSLYTSEEEKIIEETRKILGLPGLRITATAVRVPTLSAHAESVNVETERPWPGVEALREALSAFPGVRVVDELAGKRYPMGDPGPASSVEGAGGRDAVYVGRIRRDDSADHALNLWVVSDNLRKGAALNAVQIGELLVEAGAFAR